MGFTFTSLQVNDGPCGWHRDGPNVGWSAVVTCGDFSGGRLQVENVFLDAWLKPTIFDGKRCHKTEDYCGSRFVMIGFTHGLSLVTSKLGGEEVVRLGISVASTFRGPLKVGS